MSHLNPPKIIFAQLVAENKLELYWNQEVAGSTEPTNVHLALDGAPVSIQTASNDFWNIIPAYEPTKKRTTFTLSQPLTHADLGHLTIQLSANITGIDQPADPNQVYVVNNWQEFYTRFTNTTANIVIKSSTDVDSNVRLLTAKLIDTMLEKIPAVAATMATNGAAVALYGIHQDVYDILEHRGGAQILGRPVEGFGGMPGDPVTSIAAKNVLRITEGLYQTRYPNESILAHEFGHAIHLLGINKLTDQSLANEFRGVYKHAQETNLWPDTYALSNYEEYFATLTAIWFNAMAESASGTWDGVRGPINTRAELAEYDPTAYAFFAKIYAPVNLPYPWNKNYVNYDYAGRMAELPTPAALKG